MQVLMNLTFRNQITYYSSDQIEFSQNYLLNFSIQSFRSKIFLFFIDNFSLESEMFLYNFIYAQVIENFTLFLFFMKINLLEAKLANTLEQHFSLFIF